MSSTAGDPSRFSPIREDDHAGYLWIVAILGVTYTSLSGLLRAHIKWGLYGYDDVLLAVATAVHWGQAVAIFDGLNHGLGQSHRPASDGSLQVAGKAFFAAHILSILALCLSKCSILSMMLRLWTRNVDHKKWGACVVVLMSSVLWGFGSTLAVAVHCDASSILTRQNVESCPNQSARWRAIVVIDVMTDLIMSVLPAILTWRLHMATKWKVQISLAFGCRILVIPVSLLHALYLEGYSRSDEPQFAIVKCLVLQQVMITCSLVCATIPDLKTFMKSFPWGLGIGGMVSTARHASANDCELQTIGRRTTRKTRRDDAAYLNWSMDAVQHGSVVTHPATDELVDGHSLSKDDSRDMMIRKDIMWSVERC